MGRQAISYMTILQHDAKRVNPSTKALAWLAEQGAHFALPKARTKNRFESDWPNKPHTLDEATAHAAQGNNVGILTGKHSRNLVALDRDIDFPATLNMLGEAATTAKIVRDNAPGRGKLLYRVVGGDLPKSTSWKPTPSEEHPHAEILSNGRHAVVEPSEFEGGYYRLIDTRLGIREVTPAQLDRIWWLITGEHLYQQTDTPTNNSAYVQQVKDAWPTIEVFKHFHLDANGIQEERNGQLRLLGNGGLLVKGDEWYCHSDQAGGDNIAAWHWCETKRPFDKTNTKAFWDTVNAMADAAGIARPKTYTNGHSSSTAKAEAEAKHAADPTPADDDERSTKVNKPTKIYQLALEYAEFFTGSDGVVYAAAKVKDHTEFMKVSSMRFRQWLGQLYYFSTGSVAGKSSCEEAIELLSFQSDKQRTTYLRVGGNGQSIYIDIGNEKWEAIEVNAQGWQVVESSPVAFRRSAKMKALPTPERVTNVDASLKELFTLINVAQEDRILVLAWLLAAMRDKGPYPILALIAEAGSAKTTTAKALKRLVSPYVAETRSRPKTVEDVYVAANNDWVLIYDNLSSIPQDISDAFCRLATGGGYATRELYTDLDEAVSDQQQPLIINGVSDIIKKGDLMSRTLTITCPEITPDRRIEEDTWERQFQAAQPRILGALLELLSAVLAELPNTRLTDMPRMADFAKLGAALDVVTGLAGKPDSFTKRYSESITRGTMAVIDISPIYRPLYRFMRSIGTAWEGSATALLDKLRKHAKENERFDLPKQGNQLSAVLSDISTNLRMAGILDVRRSNSHRKGRSFSIHKMKMFTDCAPDEME